MSAKIKAVVLHGKNDEQVVKEVDKPTPKAKPNAPVPGEIGDLLIKVKATALNPVDWKAAQYEIIKSYPATLGFDTAGIVEAVGEGITEFSVGDEVISFVEAGSPGYGSFSEYTLSEAATTIKKPPHLSWEQAATIPVGAFTAALGLYHELSLPLPTENPSWFQEEFILIWGGASSVGSYAVQLAANTGLVVIATASPKNHDYLRSIGAACVIDYNAPDVIDQINSITQNRLKYVFDVIGAETSNIGLKVLAQNGKIACAASGPTDTKDGVQVKSIFLGGARSQGKLDVVNKLAKVVEQLLFEGRIQPNNVENIGGLEGVPAGIQKLKEGKVSACKLVVKLD